MPDKLVKIKIGFFKVPLNLTESFSLAVFIIMAGFFLEFISGRILIHPPPWPYNMLLVFIFWTIVIYSSFKAKDGEFIHWLSSAKAAIPALVFFAVLVLLLGLIPQVEQDRKSFLQRFGLTHILHSWLWMLSCIYLLTVLAFAVVKKLRLFNLRSIAYILSHLGIWIIIAAGSIGSSDIYSFKMPVYKGSETAFAFDHRHNAYKMPFSIRLNDFYLQEYPPTLAIINNNDNSLVIHKGEKFVIAGKNEKGLVGNWNVFITNYYPNAIKNIKGIYLPDSGFGSGPAAYVIVNEINSDKLKEGWISSGSVINPGEVLKLNQKYSLIMTSPPPKNIISLIRIHDHDSAERCMEISINMPLKIKKWNIYQAGYDETMGKWSDYSMLKTVFDPWQDLINFGIYMLIAGSLFLLFAGKRRIESDDGDR